MLKSTRSYERDPRGKENKVYKNGLNPPALTSGICHFVRKVFLVVMLKSTRSYERDRAVPIEKIRANA